MDHETTAPTLNDPGPQRLPLVFAHATAVAIGALPVPRPDSAQARAARDMSAIAQIAALVPANATEVMVSVQFVVTNAQGLECLRRAEALPDGADAWRAGHQAATLLRISHAAANLLLRLQAARERREATPDVRDSAALTEHCVLQSMTEALAAQALVAQAAGPAQAPAARAQSAAQPAQPPPPAADREPRLAADPAPDPAADSAADPGPVTAAHIAAAEAYAQSNPTNTNRARILRRKAGVPNWAMFTPPAPEIVNALVHGHSPILDALLPGPTG